MNLPHHRNPPDLATVICVIVLLSCVMALACGFKSCVQTGFHAIDVEMNMHGMQQEAKRRAFQFVSGEPTNTTNCRECHRKWRE